MSAYLGVWNEAKTMNLTDIDNWIRLVGDPKGSVLYFKGFQVIDTDLLEVLRYTREEVE